jgi:hypothetical protein
MSTARVADTRKFYEVSDDLESFFFVILYEALHWVVHEELKTVNVIKLFDEIQYVDGRRIGGEEKKSLYTVRPEIILKELQFESSPFTDLIRGLFCLFQPLAVVNQCKERAQRPPCQELESINKLEDCKEIIKLLKTAVERTDWAEGCDKAEQDNYPSIKSRPPIAPKVVKRPRENDEGDQTPPAKRPKV